MPDTEGTGRLTGEISSSSVQILTSPTLRRSKREHKLKVRLEVLPSRPSAKKLSSRRKFASPEKYSHLNALQDHLAPNLDIVFCGINPEPKSAEIGHYFCRPNNHFWPCLHESGFTSERIQPTQDHTLPERFSVGLTTLVERPTAEQNELSRTEQLESVPILLSKLGKYKPRIVCFVGLGIAKLVKLHALPKAFKQEKGGSKVGYGLQTFRLVFEESGSEAVTETLFYAVASTSGRVVQYQKKDKVKQFKELKQLLEDLKTGVLDTSKLHTINHKSS